MSNFRQLIKTIALTHQQMQLQAVNAVNRTMTMRNWLIGYYIVEFEQQGKDRAKYGERLLEAIAEKTNIKGLSVTSLKLFRQFYLIYPQIGQTLSDQFSHLLIPEKANSKISQTLSDQSRLQLSPDKILNNLSFSHLAELIKVPDTLKRTFYETEAIKGIWGVRELKRQINSLYFERSSLSAKPKKLSASLKKKVTPQKPVDIIKNVYAFEFLDLGVKEIVEESDLEAALLDNLQSFILELGNGFCLEARQKRILIGETYYFIDLVFYHRILKCHVLLELKIGAFEHNDLGQLNTYLNFFRKEIKEKGDNPPVGILLVAEKDHALVKYATAGMDENLFVQKYMIQLPKKGKLKKYIENEILRLK